MKSKLELIFLPVIIFLIVTGIFIHFGSLNNVMWELFAKGIKDLFLIFFAITMIQIVKKKINKTALISMVVFLGSIFSIRICCAIISGIKYNSYKLLVNSEYISYFAELIILILITIIITSGRE